jgi:shikimate dehydrogenase
MHNAAFVELGLDWRYRLLPTRPGQLGVRLDQLDRQRFRGANITVPHKQSIILYLDRLSATAQAIGAVNTVVFGRQGTVGDNTDGRGFLDALRHAGFDPAGQRALVLGAGGGARGVTYALADVGCSVTLYNRTQERAILLARDMQRAGYKVSVIPVDTAPWAELDPDRWDLLVNTTPLGMWPDTQVSPWPDAVPIPPNWTIFDLVYNPAETRLLQQARKSGAQAIDGLEMLVRQGARSFEMWTGIQPPIGTMRSAAQQALDSTNTIPED